MFMFKYCASIYQAIDEKGAYKIVQMAIVKPASVVTVLVGAILIVVAVTLLGPRVQTLMTWPPSSFFICVSVYLMIPSIWILINSQMRLDFIRFCIPQTKVV